MLDRPADDARALHAAITSRRRSSSSSGKQRQAENGEVVALDALEQLDAAAFDLIGADDAEHDAVADRREIVVEERIGERAHDQRADCT